MTSAHRCRHSRNRFQTPALLPESYSIPVVVNQDIRLLWSAVAWQQKRLFHGMEISIWCNTSYSVSEGMKERMNRRFLCLNYLCLISRETEFITKCRPVSCHVLSGIHKVFVLRSLFNAVLCGRGVEHCTVFHLAPFTWKSCAPRFVSAAVFHLSYSYLQLMAKWRQRDWQRMNFYICMCGMVNRFNSYAIVSSVCFVSCGRWKYGLAFIHSSQKWQHIKSVSYMKNLYTLAIYTEIEYNLYLYTEPATITTYTDMYWVLSSFYASYASHVRVLWRGGGT